jgi:hypothetical protein
MALRGTAMQDRPTRQNDKSEDTNQVTGTRLESTGEVVVEHHDSPPPGPPDKRIHPRRPLPLVPTARPEPEESKDKNTDSDKGTSTR